MSEEDKDLERLKAKRLAEMRNNISSQREQEKVAASQKEQQDKKPSPREIIVKRLGYRGMEVLQNAEYQFPRETEIIVLKLSELISSGDIKEVLDGIIPSSWNQYTNEDENQCGKGWQARIPF